MIYKPTTIFHIPLLEDINDIYPNTPTMRSAKIDSIDNAMHCVQYRKYLVGSISATGLFSVALNPVSHVDAVTARAEAKRLATDSPGKLFVIIELVGAELVPNTRISI